MPGILPMKVIKMGAGAHLRIAQACDRCRSKKIRCDGIRPTCSQCASVSFECKTSDKLSRRAFPRGYTESLEERVRSLEGEVRELKDLLDEKDEKIDMMIRINPKAPSLATQARATSPKVGSGESGNCTGNSTGNSTTPPDSEHMAEDDVIFTVQQAPFLTEDGEPESYFVGTSSSISFLESFKHRIQQNGKPISSLKADALLRTATRHEPVSRSTVLSRIHSPLPRLLTDHFVNIFFQEWAPLFPVLHRPTFLTLYEQFVSAPDTVTDKKSIAQLYLTFGLAALSQGGSQAELASIEFQWQDAFQQIQADQCLATLQCCLLAQLYCMQKGDCSQLLVYKALAISLASRLGLPQSQKRFDLGTLTCETRKKAFWTLYTIDCFSAVQLGLPRQIRDDEVFCELPVDADDEYVTEKGFQPLLPGEATRISSALALFRAAKVLSNVLNTAYPALHSYEISSRQISMLGHELDEWHAALAPHLRLPFAQDKPSAGSVSSRAPLLSLVYHYIRALIHRPIICASNSISECSASMVTFANSCKHMTQIVSLLSERGLGFSFCANREELLVLSGLGLLMQGLDLEAGSMILKDNQKTLAMLILQLDKSKAPESSEFRRVACTFLPAASPRSLSDSKQAVKSRHASEGSMPAPHSSTIPAGMKQHYKVAISPSHSLDGVIGHHRSPSTGASQRSRSFDVSPDSTAQNAMKSERSRSTQESQAVASPSQPSVSSVSTARGAQESTTGGVPRITLDYLSFSSGTSTPGANTQHNGRPGQTSWERLLSSIDNGSTNLHDNIYGGAPVELTGNTYMTGLPQSREATSPMWDTKLWTEASEILQSLDRPGAISSSSDLSYGTSAESESRSASLPKISFDGSASTEDVEMYKGIHMPDLAISDDGMWDTIDPTFTTT